MPDSIGTQLLDFGALGIMVLFLIWQHLGMQKRLDTLVESFQEQIDRIDKSFDERVELMRTRYDAVIISIRKDCREAEDKVAAQRDKLQADLAGIVQDADRKLDALITKLSDG
tara:strand:- start:213 stop:551 length:339 start_codon:yes stop_codon:yes gene_type:complete